MTIEYVNSAYDFYAVHAGTHTYAFDAGSTANRVLFVLARTDRGGTQTLDSCTYNGVAMSAESGFTSTITFFDGRLFYLVNPASGENDIVLTHGGSNTGTGILACVWSGVNQSVPYDAYAEFKGNSTTNLTTSLVSEGGDKGVLMHYRYPSATTYSAAVGTTERFNTSPGVVVDKDGATSLSIGGTSSSNNEYWGVKFNLNAATTGGAKRALLLGVG